MLYISYNKLNNLTGSILLMLLCSGSRTTCTFAATSITQLWLYCAYCLLHSTIYSEYTFCWQFCPIRDFRDSVECPSETIQTPCLVYVYSSSRITRNTHNPSFLVSGCMFMFGLVTCLQGLTQNYSGILATRFFLGISPPAYALSITDHCHQALLKAACSLAVFICLLCT